MVFAPHASNNGGNRASHGNSHRAQREQAAQEAQAATQAALERALGLRGDSLPTPGGPVVTTPLRNATSADNGASLQQANSAAPPRSAARSLVRERETAEALERSGVVRRCWEQFKLRNPAAPRRSISIQFSVSDTGVVTLRVPDNSEPTLSNCIERGSRDVRNLGVGAATTGSTRVDLD
jgi:hypothetical protein